MILIKAAVSSLKQIYADGYKYKKAGICLSDISPATQVTADLFSNIDLDARMSTLQYTMESVCDKFGKTAVTIGTVADNSGWTMRRENKSPDYLTDINQIPLAN